MIIFLCIHVGNFKNVNKNSDRNKKKKKKLQQLILKASTQPRQTWDLFSSFSTDTSQTGWLTHVTSKWPNAAWGPGFLKQNSKIFPVNISFKVYLEMHIPEVLSVACWHAKSRHGSAEETPWGEYCLHVSTELFSRAHFKRCICISILLKSPLTIQNL